MSLSECAGLDTTDAHTYMYATGLTVLPVFFGARSLLTPIFVAQKEQQFVLVLISTLHQRDDL